jgi:superfamily II DNA/RNA helicase
VPDSLENQYMICKNRLHKIEVLFSMLLENNESKMMIFLNTCASVDFYSKIIRALPFLKSVAVSEIHG